MQGVTAEAQVPTPPVLSSPIVVLAVDDDPGIRDLVSTVLSETDGFEVRTAASANQALDNLDGVDCVVSDYEMPGRDGLELLDAVREREPSLPFVLYSSAADSSVIATLLESDRTAFIAKNGQATATELLPHRVRQVVTKHRLATLAGQALTAVDMAHSGLAAVDGDRRFTFVNREYAQRFGQDREALLGQSWENVYTDEGIELLESTAIPAIDDGWRWTGECPAHGIDGETVSMPTCIVGLADGSLVIAVRDE